MPPIPNSKLSRTRPTNCILFRINHKKFTDKCTFLADSGVQFNIWVKLIHQNVNADDFSGLFETSIQSDKDLSLAATDIPLSNDWASMEGLDSVTAINRIFNQLQLKAEVFDSLDTEQRSGRRRQAQVHFLNDNDPPTAGTSTLDCCSDFGNKDIDYLEPAVQADHLAHQKLHKNHDPSSHIPAELYRLLPCEVKLAFGGDDGSMQQLMKFMDAFCSSKPPLDAATTATTPTLQHSQMPFPCLALPK